MLQKNVTQLYFWDIYYCYLSLHKSPFYKDKHDGRTLPETDRYSDCLVRLPMYYDIDAETQELIIDKIITF